MKNVFNVQTVEPKWMYKPGWPKGKVWIVNDIESVSVSERESVCSATNKKKKKTERNRMEMWNRKLVWFGRNLFVFLFFYENVCMAASVLFYWTHNIWSKKGDDLHLEEGKNAHRPIEGEHIGSAYTRTHINCIEFHQSNTIEKTFQLCRFVSFNCWYCRHSDTCAYALYTLLKTMSIE